MIALGCGLTFRASNMSYLFVGFQIIPLFSFFPIIINRILGCKNPKTSCAKKCGLRLISSRFVYKYLCMINQKYQ